MKNTVIFIILFLFHMPQLALAQSTLECSAFYVNKGLSQPIKLSESKYGDQSVFRGDIGLAHYSVHDDYSGKVEAMITFGPEYTKGSVATTDLKNNNQVKLAVVDGLKVYKIICRPL